MATWGFFMQCIAPAQLAPLATQSLSADGIAAGATDVLQTHSALSKNITALRSHAPTT
jgi:hypothetical protein